MRKSLFVVLAAMLLSGCWQSNGALYHDTRTVTPFRPGAVTGTGPDGKRQHYALTLSGHAYRLIITDKGDDIGNGFALRFFPLSGSPPSLLVYEAVALEHCNSAAGCDHIKSEDPRYYGLVQVKMHGAGEIRPDCRKDAAASRAAGVIADKDGVCTFKDRAALDASLHALARSGRKPDYEYSIAE